MSMDKHAVLREGSGPLTDRVADLEGERDLEPIAWLDGLVRDDGSDIHFVPDLDDIMVQCPRCNALETLQFVGVTLTPCRKFSQKDGKIYHDCGSRLPCRLYK